ncbi:MAG: hypothetical protein APR55_04535 [Methanolinea sp. SDB]|nr:MAG: hypothetical protein APR55_04535 [Methanolinea sp. SDB]
MDHPPPHSFSRSPVDEVFFSCTCESGSESRSLTIPAPYPGWPYIRDAIMDMIAGAGEVSRITGCMMSYTDLFPVVDGTDLPGTGDIVDLLSGRFDCSLDKNGNEIMLISTKIPNTAGSVRSIWNRPKKPGWTLVFTLKTDRPAGFVSGESVLNWFSDVRAEIHLLFDLIVPEEIVQTLR